MINIKKQTAGSMKGETGRNKRISGSHSWTPLGRGGFRRPDPGLREDSCSHWRLWIAVLNTEELTVPKTVENLKVPLNRKFLKFSFLF